MADAEARAVAAEADFDSLVRELAVILGPGKPPTGVTRAAYWIARVGAALGAAEAERDTLRQALECIRDEQEPVMTHTGMTHTSKFGWAASSFARAVLAGEEPT